MEIQIHCTVQYCIFLVLAMILGWATCDINFTIAFLQADLPCPLIWILAENAQ